MSSQQSLASCMPTPGWSCATLEHGVHECARIAGLELQPKDAEKAWRPWPYIDGWEVVGLIGIAMAPPIYIQ